MADGRNRAEWNIAAHLMASLWNSQRVSKRSPWFEPSDFSPYVKTVKRGIPLKVENLHLLKEVFVDRKG
jgi:hypothetical protein